VTESLVPVKPRTHLSSFRKQWSSLPANERLASLMNVPDGIRVVRAMPVLDLYTTIHEVGRGDCLELLELLDPKQVQGILDLDGWRSDRMDSSSIGGWLEAFFAANHAQGIKQFLGLDIELISLLLKVHTQIFELEHEEVPDDPGLHSITPDQRYMVIFDRASGSEQLILGLKQAVELLFGRDLAFVLRLIEAVRWELQSAVEEEAYRWRNGRLSDMGFLDADRPGELFAFIDPDRFAKKRPTAAPPIEEEYDPDDEVNYASSVLVPPVQPDSADNLFGHALSFCSPELVERVSHELILLGNRCHLSEQGDLGDPDALRDTLRQVVRTCEIGLAYLSQGKEEELSSLLSAHPLLLLFQIGNSVGLRLARKLRALIQNQNSGLHDFGILRVDSPLREVLAGVLGKRPQLYLGLLQDSRTDYRSFGTLQEIAETAKAVTEAGFRASLMGGKGFRVTDERLKNAGVTDLSIAPPSATLLNTLLIVPILKKPRDFGPVGLETIEELRQQLPRTTVDEASRELLFPDETIARAMEIVDTAATHACPMVGAGSPEAAGMRARAYATDCLLALQHELMGIGDEPADLRFLKTIWTREAYPMSDTDGLSDEPKEDNEKNTAQTDGADNPQESD
jgi:hypothetical protein